MFTLKRKMIYALVAAFVLSVVEFMLNLGALNPTDLGTKLFGQAFILQIVINVVFIYVGHLLHQIISEWDNGR